MRRRQLIGLVSATLLSACASLQPAVLDASASAELAKVQTYLNSLRTLRADFLQVAPNGAISSGTAWLLRPGRLRLDYAPPAQAELVADKGEVSLHDDATEATTTTPLSRTPLSILLADQIALNGAVTVTKFQAAPNSIVLTLVSTARPGQGSLTLLLQTNPLTLHGLTLTDARGDTTRLLLSHLQTAVTPPAAMF